MTVPPVVIEYNVDDRAEALAAEVCERYAAMTAGTMEFCAFLAEQINRIPHGSKATFYEALPFSENSAQLMARVGRHEYLSNPDHGQHLPSSWRTLAVLARIDADALARYCEDGRVTPEMTRKQAEWLAFAREEFLDLDDTLTRRGDLLVGQGSGTSASAWLGEVGSVNQEHVAIKGRAHVAHNSGENEWYTPAEYVEAAHSVMGGVDLDPASNEVANAVVRAERYFTVEDDGLTQPWHGRVWMNPPYSQPLIAHFCERLVGQYGAGNVSEAVVLVNNATETKWWQGLATVASAVCLPRGRVSFWHPERKSAAPLQGQSVLYLGEHVESFFAAFTSFGNVAAFLAGGRHGPTAATS